MTSEEAMDGHSVTMTEAVRELRKHNIETLVVGSELWARSWRDEPWEQLPLNSRDILQWLGY